MAEMADIQWFPGHMTKTRRMIKANLSLVDGIVEIIDARIPLSSRNPDMDSLIGDKPRMFLLNKCDLADEKATAKWVSVYRSQGFAALPVDCKSGKGIKNFIPTVRNQLLKQLIDNRVAKGMTGRQLRIMIVGIPNVGKSSFINKMAGANIAKAEDRPGVTRTKQWVKLGDGIEMLDMPGVLWPKFDDQNAARKLAFTGAVKDDILDIEDLAMNFLEFMAKYYPDSISERYKFRPQENESGLQLLENLGRKRGMMMKGGEVNTERAAITVLDEYRSGKLGRITLEMPSDL